MAEGKDYSSIKPLDSASQKEAMPFLGLILLTMIVTLAAVFIVGAVIDSL
ncbi:MAG: hypothetical protein L0229_16830 [Blastocatellia bacterium]|nr:hypothetical protein [Blastocatellia bacterium]